MHDQDTTAKYRLLVDVIQKLSLAKTLGDITAVVRSAARALTGADGATFVLRDQDLCFYADEDAVAPLWKGKRFPMKSCISGWVMLNKEQVVIPDIYKDDRIPHNAYRPTFVQSMTMVPIRREAPIGAIGIYWSDHHVPAQSEIELLQALADSTSISMQNIDLYRELQDRVEDLDKSNRIKDEFLMSMSHELRTPLNAISGWSSILESGKMNANDAASAGKTIFRNAKALGTIVDDLLDVAQIMTGQIHLDRKAVDTARILAEAVDSMSVTAAEKT